MNFKSASSRYAQYIIVLAVSIALVAIIDLSTNSIDTYRDALAFRDFAYFIDMAENGIIGNDHLLAPFAYRFVIPLLARIIIKNFAVSTATGFRVIAYIGAISQLFLVFLLAKRFSSFLWHGLILTVITAFSLCNVKFLLFDVYRADHLAYPLMIIAALALFDRNIILCILASCLGLLIREFLIIPPIILFYVLFREYLKERSKVKLLWISIAFFSVFLTIFLPRRIIPVLKTSSYTFPISNSDSISKIAKTPLLLKKNFNILFGLASYMLPAILLSTKQRLRQAWLQLAEYRSFIIIYSGCVLLLVVYGGADIMRYVTYIFIPQIILVSIFLKNRVDIREIIFMLIALAIYNRIFFKIPIWNFELYLDFMGSYGDRINAATIKRLFELIIYVLLAVSLRVFLRYEKKGHQAA